MNTIQDIDPNYEHDIVSAIQKTTNPDLRDALLHRWCTPSTDLVSRVSFTCAYDAPRLSFTGDVDVFHVKESVIVERVFRTSREELSDIMEDIIPHGGWISICVTAQTHRVRDYHTNAVRFSRTVHIELRRRQ